MMIKSVLLTLCSLFFVVGVFADDLSFSTTDRWKAKEKCAACKSKQKCKCGDGCDVAGNASIGPNTLQTITELNSVVRFSTIGRKVGKGVNYTPYSTFVLEPGTYYVHVVVYYDELNSGFGQTSLSLSARLDGESTGLTTPNLLPLATLPMPIVLQGFVSVTGSSCKNLTVEFQGLVAGSNVIIGPSGSSISILQLESGY